MRIKAKRPTVSPVPGDNQGEVNSPQSLLQAFRKGGRVAGGRNTTLPTENLFPAARNWRIRCPREECQLGGSCSIVTLKPNL